MSPVRPLGTLWLILFVLTLLALPSPASSGCDEGKGGGEGTDGGGFSKPGEPKRPDGDMAFKIEGPEGMGSGLNIYLVPWIYDGTGVTWQIIPENSGAYIAPCPGCIPGYPSTDSVARIYNSGLTTGCTATIVATTASGLTDQQLILDYCTGSWKFAGEKTCGPECQTGCTGPEFSSYHKGCTSYTRYITRTWIPPYNCPGDGCACAMECEGLPPEAGCPPPGYLCVGLMYYEFTCDNENRCSQ